MKHAKTLLAWLLVLSLSLGLVITTTAADSTDAPLTITKVVELNSGIVQVHFSEPVTLLSRSDGYHAQMSVVLLNEDGTKVVKKADGTDAKWERTSAADLKLSTDGTYVSFDWTLTGSTEEVMEFAYNQVRVHAFENNYQFGFMIRDLSSGNVVDGYIDFVVSQANPSKKLVAETKFGTTDCTLFAGIETAKPYLLGVDKVSPTTYEFHFSKPITANLDANTGIRPALCVLNTKTNANVLLRVNNNGHEGTATLSQDRMSLFIDYKKTSIAAILDRYMENMNDYIIQVRIYGRDADADRFMHGIADDAGNSAYADIKNSVGADVLTWNVTNAMYPYVWVGDDGYDTMADAMKNAKASDMVKLNRDNDCRGETLVVPAGVTLDLGGKKLTVANVVSFGNVIDSVGGGTLVMSDDRTEALLSLLPSNTMLPLYDATAGGYKFFNQTLVGGGPVKGTATSVKFGVKLSFTDTAAYELLKSGQVKLGLDLKIERDGHVNNLTYVFKDATIEAYADSVLGNSAGNYYVVLQISGLEAGDLIQAVPVMEMADGKAFDAEMKADTVLSYTVA